MLKVMYGTPSHSYGVSLAISNHTVLAATQHKWTHHILKSKPVVIYLARKDRRLSGPRLPVTDGDGLPAHKQSPIHDLTRQHMAGSQARNTLITTSQVRCYNHYTMTGTYNNTFCVV